MEFLLNLIVSLVLVLLLREPIKRWPVAFYALAGATVTIFFLGCTGAIPGAWWKPLIVPMQRCMMALSLFAIVMFIGVIPKGSKLDAWLRPIRAELSIIACILCFGHMCVYLAAYASRVLSGALSGYVTASLVVAIALFVLWAVLGATSIGLVKQQMKAKVWKAIQRFAYLFFALAYVHLLFMLVPPAMRGGEQAIASVVIYSALFGSYLVLRIIRWAADRQPEKADCKESDELTLSAAL